MKTCLAFSPLLFLASSAQAATLIFSATLSGPNESPVNNSPGTGTALITIDDVALTMRVQANFTGLTGNVTNAHIHAATTAPFAGTAGVATTSPTFTGFPAGATSGSYDNTLNMALSTSYNAPYLSANGGTPAGAFTALENAIIQGRAYFNIHSTTFGGGEIRGFLVPAPEPTVVSLLAVAGAWGLSRRRRA